MEPLLNQRDDLLSIAMHRGRVLQVRISKLQISEMFADF
jgi:hypothetical protein